MLVFCKCYLCLLWIKSIYSVLPFWSKHVWSAILPTTDNWCPISFFLTQSIKFNFIAIYQSSFQVKYQILKVHLDFLVCWTGTWLHFFPVTSGAHALIFSASDFWEQESYSLALCVPYPILWPIICKTLRKFINKVIKSIHHFLQWRG